MTPQVHQFIARHKNLLTGRVLEIGSFNVNGSVRDVIDVAVGVDIRPGKGVDLVCQVEDLPKHFSPCEFDACVSTETLEHVKDWRAFFAVTWDMVKPGGWLVMTMASMDKGRHDYPDDYWRFDLDQIAEIYPVLEFCGPIGRPNKPVSIGWVAQKAGILGPMDFEPYTV
mgnify:FL=1